MMSEPVTHDAEARAQEENGLAMELVYQAARKIEANHPHLPPTALGLSLINCGARYGLEHVSPGNVLRYLLRAATIEHGGDDVRH